MCTSSVGCSHVFTQSDEHKLDNANVIAVRNMSTMERLCGPTTTFLENTVADPKIAELQLLLDHFLQCRVGSIMKNQKNAGY